MAAASRYLEKKLLDHTLGVASYAAVSSATLRMALFTATPGETNNTAVEVSAGGYARQPITFSAAITASTGSSSTNAALVQFGPASVDWGTLTHWGIYDAASAGNLLYYGPLSPSVTITNGSTYQFPAGTVLISVD